MNREPLPSPTRIPAIDWLRVLAVLAIFVLHVAHIFAFGTAASIQNAETSLPATVVMHFILQWAVALLFVMAGAGNWFSLRSRATRPYLRERAARLLLPLVFGSIVLIPWIGYLRALNHGTFDGNFWSYLPVHVEQTRAWLATPELRHGLVALYYTSWHLWFLGYLLIFSVLSLPLLRRVSGAAWLSALCERRYGLAALGVPILVIRLAVGPAFPDYLDWADTLLFFTCFVYGWLFMTDARYLRAVGRDAPIWLAVGCVTYALLLAAHALGYMTAWLAHSNYSAGYLLYQGILAINSWAWIVAVTGYGMRWLTTENAVLRYASGVALPFYILHQVAIATVAVLVVQWPVGIGLKVIAIGGGAFTLTLLAYELLIKRISLLRLLFGMKPETTARSGAERAAACRAANC